MKIRYRKLPDILDPTTYSHYPYLQVCIRYQQNAGQPLFALVDSGAIDTLFPAALGDTLGIDVLSGERKVYFGIGGHAAVGYIHECDMQVSGFNTWIKMRIGFLDTIRIPLLGQSGFFENYQVLFERFRYQFEIYPKIDALIRGSRGRRRR